MYTCTYDHVIYVWCIIIIVYYIVDTVILNNMHNARTRNSVNNNSRIYLHLLLYNNTIGKINLYFIIVIKNIYTYLYNIHYTYMSDVLKRGGRY